MLFRIKKSRNNSNFIKWMTILREMSYNVV